MFSERSISAVPIINEDGIVVNLYETVDVIVCAFHRRAEKIIPHSIREFERCTIIIDISPQHPDAYNLMQSSIALLAIAALAVL